MFINSSADTDIESCISENNVSKNFYVVDGSPRFNMCSASGNTDHGFYLTNATSTLSNVLVAQALAAKNSGITVANTSTTSTVLSDVVIRGADFLSYGIDIQGSAETKLQISNLDINQVRNCGINSNNSARTEITLSNALIKNVAQGATKGATRAAIYCSNTSILKARNLTCELIGGEAIRGLDFAHLDVDGVLAINVLSFVSGYVFYIQNQTEASLGASTKSLISIRNVQMTGKSNTGLKGIYLDCATQNILMTGIDFSTIYSLGNAGIVAGATYGGISNITYPLIGGIDPVEEAATAALLLDITADINVYGKYAGKKVWDVTNNRMMRARASTAGAVWDVIDGSVSVTPV